MRGFRLILTSHRRTLMITCFYSTGYPKNQCKANWTKKVLHQVGAKITPLNLYKDDALLQCVIVKWSDQLLQLIDYKGVERFLLPKSTVRIMRNNESSHCFFFNAVKCLQATVRNESESNYFLHFYMFFPICITLYQIYII